MKTIFKIFYIYAIKSGYTNRIGMSELTHFVAKTYTHFRSVIVINSVKNQCQLSTFNKIKKLRSEDHIPKYIVYDHYIY